MPKLTTKLLAKLEAWKKAGDRSINIDLKRDGPGTIWVYDYKLNAGTFISDKNADAEWVLLMVQEKRNELLAQLNKLDGGIAS